MPIETKILSAFAPWCLTMETSAGAVVFRRARNQQIQYLMIQYRHGHWEFPRGHQEEGETLKQTALREIAEETGLTDIKLMPNFLEKMSFSYTAKGNEKHERIKAGRCVFIYKKVYFYLGQSFGQEVTLSHEHKNYAWLPYRAALAKLSFDNGRRILASANKYLLAQKPTQ